MHPLKYVGGDIVKPLIDNLNTTKQQATALQKPTFLHFDITKNEFPKVDLWLCRDCLFHLSYHVTWLALDKFIQSYIPYMLTTTHCNSSNFLNSDIKSGEFRFMDLFLSPYNFPEPLYRVEDWQSPDTPREMCLWSREQILIAMNKNN